MTATAQTVFFRSPNPLKIAPICAIVRGRLGMEDGRGEVTLLLARLAAGDRTAEDELMPRVYLELHRLASSRLRSERPDHTLQATALVHEVYLRLCRSEEIRYQDRAHFFRIAARMMRRILVDYGRRTDAEKRPKPGQRRPFEEAAAVVASERSECSPEDAVEIDRLLTEFEAENPRQAEVVEMRFFGGLTEEEIGAALGIHPRTVRRDWLMARAWLHKKLKPGHC
jgi:RNA polymerase sigma factor (TIGR02999 family)